LGKWFGLPFFIMIAIGIDAALDDMTNNVLEGVIFLALMIFPIYVFFFAPVLGLIILNAVSREREFLADADACLLTRYPDGLARALTKMDAGDNAKMKVNSATAHLYVLNPLGKNKSFMSRIIASHPSTKERIEILASLSPMISPEVLRDAEKAGKQFCSIRPPL